jgi:3-polyprenyl-4-hydroxybenzoate decarboxylase
MLSSYLRFFEDETVKIKFFGDIKKYLKSKNVILFENVKGFRVVANIWGTRERIARAMKINEKEIPKMLSKAMENPIECEEVKTPPFLENVIKNFDLRNIAEISSGVAVSKEKMFFSNFKIIDKKRLKLSFTNEKRIDIAIGLCPSILLPSVAGCSLKIASSLRYLTLKEEVYDYNLNGIRVPGYAEVIMEGIAEEEKILKIKKIYYKNDPLFQIILPEEYDLLRDISRDATRMLQNL